MTVSIFCCLLCEVYRACVRMGNVNNCRLTMEMGITDNLLVM